MTLNVPFVQAHDFTDVKVKRRVDFIVLHDMETPEKGDAAETCAAYFARDHGAPSSAHYCVDANSIVQCVRDNDIAYHAPPNTHSIGVEHAGYARQSRLQWRDPYSKAMLKLSSKLVAHLCDKYDLPTKFLAPEDLRAGRRGITTHANVSAAFRQSTHTDPGPHFPIGLYLTYVRIHRNHKEDIVLDADIQKIADAVTAQLEKSLADPDSALSQAFTDRVRKPVQAELRDERQGQNPGQAGAKPKPPAK